MLEHVIVSRIDRLSSSLHSWDPVREEDRESGRLILSN